MRLTVVGCSPSWPNPGGAHSGYLVEDGAHRILLDCGPGVLARLIDGGEWPDLDAIVLTHFHLDHAGDLVPWVWGSLHLESRGVGVRKPELWVPAGGQAMLDRFGDLLGFRGMFGRAFSVHEYTPAAEFTAGGHAIAATKVPHYGVDAHALRVTAGGRALAYSGDSGPSNDLAAAAEGADLFVCEATLESGEPEADARGHLSLDEALAVHERSGAKALLITHRPWDLERPAGIDFAQDGVVRQV